MSIRVMSAIWDLDLPDSEKLVALALADWCNDDGECWPSVPQIAKKCSKSERTVQNVTASLEAKGHLSRNMIPGRGCKYHLHPRKGCTTTPAVAAPVTPRSRCTPAKSAPVQGTTDTPAAAAPNTSVTIISSEANASSDKRTRATNENWHRLPEGWEPAQHLPAELAEAVAQWPPGKIESELNALRDWAANASNERGKGRKLNWDRAWQGWLRRADEDWRRRNANDRNGGHRGYHQREPRVDGFTAALRNVANREADYPFAGNG